MVPGSDAMHASGQTVGSRRSCSRRPSGAVPCDMAQDVGRSSFRAVGLSVSAGVAVRPGMAPEAMPLGDASDGRQGLRLLAVMRAPNAFVLAPALFDGWCPVPVEASVNGSATGLE